MKRYFMIFARVITYRGIKSVYTLYVETDGYHPMVEIEEIKNQIRIETTAEYAPIGNTVEIAGWSEITEQDYESLKNKRWENR